jgi:hypothetical protein
MAKELPSFPGLCQAVFTIKIRGDAHYGYLFPQTQEGAILLNRMHNELRLPNIGCYSTGVIVGSKNNHVVVSEVNGSAFSIKALSEELVRQGHQIEPFEEKQSLQKDSLRE